MRKISLVRIKDITAIEYNGNNYPEVFIDDGRDERIIVCTKDYMPGGKCDLLRTLYDYITFAPTHAPKVEVGV